MIKIYAKIGTHPAGYYRAMRKKNPPQVGDRLVLRGFSLYDWEDIPVRVTEIKELPGQVLYFVERF